MDNSINDLFNKMKLIKEEDYIWIIYIFIALFALISNYYEKDYLNTKNINDYTRYKNINTTIFIVAFFIYLYFLIISYDSLKKSNGKNQYTNFIRFTAALLFLIAGAMYIYTDYKSNTDDFPIEII